MNRFLRAVAILRRIYRVMAEALLCSLVEMLRCARKALLGSGDAEVPGTRCLFPGYLFRGHDLSLRLWRIGLSMFA